MIENESCDAMYESEKNSSSSSDISSCVENVYDEIPNVEILCQEEEICCSKDSNFSYCSIDDIVVIIFLDQSDYGQSQEE